MRRPGLRLALDAALATGALAAVAVVLLVVVSAFERSGRDVLHPREVLLLVGPLCGAAGVALAVARFRLVGGWDGWAGLGVTPGRQLAPLLLLAAVAAALQWGAVAASSDGPSAAVAPLMLPAPVPLSAKLWPAAEVGWEEPDLSRWQAPPASLGTVELIARARSVAPVGARAGVDRAELLRRAGWSLAWLLAVGLGAGRGLARTRSRRAGGQPGLAAAAETTSLTLVWLLAVLVLSAAAAS
jgi:hypothetical protein